MCLQKLLQKRHETGIRKSGKLHGYIVAAKWISFALKHHCE